jgi:hypothetical protein
MLRIKLEYFDMCPNHQLKRKHASGRSIAQVVSRRLPTAAACFRSQFSHVGVTSERVLQFPLPILIPPTTPYLSIIRGWYDRPTTGRYIQSRLTPRKL